jgi:hypothetical protein
LFETSSLRMTRPARSLQQQQFGAAFADEVYNPKFDTLAAAFDVRYARVDGSFGVSLRAIAFHASLRSDAFFAMAWPPLFAWKNVTLPGRCTGRKYKILAPSPSAARLRIRCVTTPMRTRPSRSAK